MRYSVFLYPAVVQTSSRAKSPSRPSPHEIAAEVDALLRTLAREEVLVSQRMGKALVRLASLDGFTALGYSGLTSYAGQQLGISGRAAQELLWRVPRAGAIRRRCREIDLGLAEFTNHWDNLCWAVPPLPGRSDDARPPHPADIDRHLRAVCRRDREREMRQDVKAASRLRYLDPEGFERTGGLPERPRVRAGAAGNGEGGVVGDVADWGRVQAGAAASDESEDPPPPRAADVARLPVAQRLWMFRRGDVDEIEDVRRTAHTFHLPHALVDVWREQGRHFTEPSRQGGRHDARLIPSTHPGAIVKCRCCRVVAAK